VKLVSEQVSQLEVNVILRELRLALAKNTVGDVVEFGCYVGTTSLFLQCELLKSPESVRKLHVYDSFAGLPAKATQDESPAGQQFQAGELTATKAQLIKHFQQAHLPLPHIHKGWFNALQTKDVPRQIAFAFLDGDYYHSILDPLKLIWDHLEPHAQIVIDDYASEQLPGVKKAVDAWAQHHRFHLKVEASLAIISLE